MPIYFLSFIKSFMEKFVICPKDFFGGVSGLYGLGYKDYNLGINKSNLSLSIQ